MVPSESFFSCGRMAAGEAEVVLFAARRSNDNSLVGEEGGVIGPSEDDGGVGGRGGVDEAGGKKRGLWSLFLGERGVELEDDDNDEDEGVEVERKLGTGKESKDLKSDERRLESRGFRVDSKGRGEVIDSRCSDSRDSRGEGQANNERASSFFSLIWCLMDCASGRSI